MKKAAKEELLKLGFKEKENEKEKSLTLMLNKGKDRFYYFLEWYEDQPDKFYINEILTGKIKTISEEDFLVNTNNLKTNAIEHYKQIMEKLGRDWEKGGKEYGLQQLQGLYIRKKRNGRSTRN